MAKIVIELSGEGHLNVKCTKDIENPITLRGLLACAEDAVREYFDAAQKKGPVLEVPPVALPPLGRLRQEDGFNPFLKNGG